MRRNPETDRRYVPGDWRTETRPAGTPLDATATAKRAYRGLERTPWFATWGEVADWILDHDPVVGQMKGN